MIVVQEVRNTVGNVPLEWYEDYPHLGYNLDGKTISKPLHRDEVSHTHWVELVIYGPTHSWRSTWHVWRTRTTGGQ